MQSSGQEKLNHCCQLSFLNIHGHPRYSRSNGFVEVEVKNFKNHFQKSSDPYKMLLLLKAAHLENRLSPAELLVGRGGMEFSFKRITLIVVMPIGSNVFISDR
ncbi:hypothetical protein PR048_019648 [Dryococelus australis]|uniref:Uncharacterized protein n=1 Tax=Dryococelus australis TaxID=614101 RepID=A0ABQ9H455_9NEOP|nr:hypothetical protein PR048_019648 [Dryococelus australis]